MRNVRPDRYLAGFRDVDGEPWGLIVPLDGDDVRRLVAREERRWNVAMFQIEGIVQPQPPDWDVGDEEYGAMLEAGLLEHVAVYAIASRGEALAYLEHPVLGSRLLECTQIVCGIQNRSIGEILGSPDDLKFGSSMRLFHAVSNNPIFGNALDKFYSGASDQATLDTLRKQSTDEGSKT